MLFQKLTHRGLLVWLILFCAVAGADETSWIDGVSGPAGWTVKPTRPADVDTITFSGPVGHYWNAYEAAKDLGGKPRLHVDSENKLVELTFDSDTGRRDHDWDPVCGIKGSFGPLDAGSWVFFCGQNGAEFSVEFEILGSDQLYYVDASATGEATGLSWEDALADLQTALMIAPQGSEIRVAQGTYRPSDGGYYDVSDSNAAFHISGVTVKGGFAGASDSKPSQRDTIAYETVLSGDLNGDDVALDYLPDMMADANRLENSYHVVVTTRGDAPTVLDGLTITGGRAAGPEDELELRCGGGVYDVEGRPVIRDCVITGNAAAYRGAGICTTNNGDSGVVITDSIIFGNWCQWRGGGLYRGGIAKAVVDRCVISSNGARYRGGGFFTYGGKLSLSNCNITGNIVAETYGEGGAGAGMEARAELQYCTIVGNVASIGAALSFGSSSSYTTADVHNCIIWNGENSMANDGRSTLTVEYSNVQGGWAGTGNIAVDPCFVEVGYWDTADTAGDTSDDIWYDGDYRILPDSPCVGTGDPGATPDDGQVDLYGNPRLSGAVVDMGAYEMRNAAPVALGDPAPTGFTLDNSVGTVQFDGTNSYDPEGYPLTYRWYQDGALVSTEPTFAMELPLGEHNFSLIVNDGAGDSEPLEVTATVHQVIETELTVWPNRIRRGAGLRRFLVTLGVPGDSRHDCDTSFKMLLYPGGIEADSQNAYSWGGDIRLTAGFDRREFLNGVSGKGTIQIRAVARLKDGRFICGTGSLKIK